MKSYAKLYYITVITVFCIVSATVVQKTFQAITAIRYVTFSFDPQLSVAVCDAIVKESRRFESKGTYNTSTMIGALMTAFPIIKSIEYEQLPPHRGVIAIKAFDPLVCINGDHLLLENQSIRSAAYYAIYKVESLQKLTIAAPMPLAVSNPIMMAIKQCVAEKIFDHYTVYVANEHEWYLTDTYDSLFTICCHATSLPTEHLKTAYNRLKSCIKKKGLENTKWIADMRFQDQIILSRDKGGRYG